MRLHPFLKNTLVTIALLIAWQFILRPVMRNIKGFDEMEWHGKKFRLKQKYLDYEEYKSAYEPLSPDQVDRVKDFMLSITVPKVTQSETALRQSLREMRFPGFGSSYAGLVKDESGNRYILNEYEIPQKQEQRTLLYRIEKDGSCRLVLDGVSIDHLNDHMLDGSEVKVRDGKLKHSFHGKVYREIALQTPE